MAELATNKCLVSGQPGEDYELALVIKLTYAIKPNGQCVPAEKQLALIDEPEPYEEVESPLVSPPSWDSDMAAAFKPHTDVVVQGHAYTYSHGVDTIDAEVRIPGLSYVVRVYGDRRLEWRGNTPLFTPAENFEQMPVRYDRAYGGYDAVFKPKVTNTVVHELNKAEPGLRMECFTDRHYHRNLAGCGFLIEMNPRATENLRIPNLEFPFDPITPERLAVGSTTAWLNGPLPAAFDWIHPSWFPRIAYLGLTTEYDLSSRIMEIERGWAIPDLMAQKPLILGGFNPRFLQGASPGLVVQQFKPGSPMLFRNLFPNQPQRQIQLASNVPRVTIHVTEKQHLEANSQLSAVIVRPDLDQVIELWSARAIAQRRYEAPELQNMTWKISWK
jgi:hypothetical protein